MFAESSACSGSSGWSSRYSRSRSPGSSRIRPNPGLLCVIAITLAGTLAGCGSASNVGSTLASSSSSTAATASNPLAGVVFLGDSLTAGFQNGSLLDAQQPHGFANLIAAQAGFAITLPLIAPPGVPAVLTLVSDGLAPVLGQASGTSAGRDNPAAQPTDLAVPGYTLDDLIHSAPSALPGTNAGTMTDLVLGYPTGSTRTEVQEAIALKPSTIFLWIGGNDALPADATGSPGGMTPLARFTSDYAELIATLTAGATAHLVVANIPDVTAIPYMTPAATVLAAVAGETGLSEEQAGAQLGIATGDLVTWAGVEAVEAEVNAYKPGGTLGALSDAEVLDAAEIVAVQSLINGYNQVIAQEVAAAGGTLVDMHAFYASLAGGMTINGVHATSAYLGGLFGLDGVHPTNTGYALIANQYIAALNNAFHLSITAVNVAEVAASDPYFGANLKPGGSARMRLRRAGLAGSSWKKTSR